MRTDLVELKSFLQRELAKKIAFNNQYSKKSFARDLGISVTALNEFLSDKRELSFKNINNVFKYVNSKIHCSWCDAKHDEVEYMIAGPRHQYICNSCVDRCQELARSKKILGVKENSAV